MLTPFDVMRAFTVVPIAVIVVAVVVICVIYFIQFF